MKTAAHGLALIFLLALVACQHTAPTPTPTAAAPTADLEQVTGNVAALDLDANTVTIKLLVKKLVLEVDGSCRIITAGNNHAALADLKVGDPVEVRYARAEGRPMAHLIAVKGVTAAEREADREEDRIEKILTPNPAERPNQ